MDSTSLVERQINDGQKLVDDLLQSGFDVAAAFWLKPSESEKWLFYVISPVADADGTAEAYRRMSGPVRTMPQPYSIHPIEIRVLGTSDPLGKEVLEIHRRSSKVGLSPLSWRGSWLGNMSIDGAYLYPLPTANVP